MIESLLEIEKKNQRKQIKRFYKKTKRKVRKILLKRKNESDDYSSWGFQLKIQQFRYQKAGS